MRVWTLPAKHWKKCHIIPKDICTQTYINTYKHIQISVQFMCCNLCEWVCFPIPRSILVPAADQTELSPRVCLAWSLCWTSVHRTGTEVVWSLVLLRFRDPFLSHHDPVTFIKGTLNLRYVADTEHTAICHQWPTLFNHGDQHHSQWPAHGWLA